MQNRPRYYHLIPAGTLLAVLFSAQMVAAEELAVIQVHDQAISQPDYVSISPLDQNYVPVDTAEMLRAVPGANVNKNGTLTGIAQYRGMFGARVNTQLDGLNVAPAGPNWMDPPLSHVAPSQVKEMRVYRGVAPVSAGAESIGGVISLKSAYLPYGTGDDITPHANVAAGYDSNQQASTFAAQLGAGTANDRLQIQGNSDRGQGMTAGNGLDVVPTQYRRHLFGVDYGHDFNAGEFTLGYGHEKVENSGSPALPMDIISVKGNSYRAGYRSHDDAATRWLFDLHYGNTDHAMDNYSLRQNPLMLGMPGTPPMQRYALTHVRDMGYKLHATLPLGEEQQLTIGTDGWLARHNADVFNPLSTAFSLQNYNHTTRERFSLFTEWEAMLTSSLKIQTGARYSRVNMNSDAVSATGFGMLTGAINTLATSFNNTARAKQDNLFDLSLLLTQAINEDTHIVVGLARKQRAPAYQERYLWSPLESTAGLADKRTYVGDVNLSPETAYDMDIGVDWKSDLGYFTPHMFYKRVNHYIQGVSLNSGAAYNFRAAQGNALRGGGFCTANPADPFCTPLQFSNVSATLYGFDTGFGWNLSDAISLDGTLSYVRGKRNDVADNLYRIAPLNGMMGASYYGQDDWSLTAQSVIYGKQNDVSITNAEQKTSGYSLFNLHGRYVLTNGIDISGGVNNIFDRFYQSHLGGYNRVTTNVAGQSSAVATGSRLPGEGRSFFVQARAVF
ncbi:MAG: TonB-dependent receptor [Mariprofundaceae bacterium]|nr:TonB-dependent receptor [Mariprofundaceae bacterium]